VRVVPGKRRSYREGQPILEGKFMKAKRFLISKELSSCCSKNSIIVRSRRGGLVSQNCLKCGKPRTINQKSLPDLECEICQSKLNIEKFNGRNYFNICKKCKRKWKLPDEVPVWQDLFEYYGLGIRSDNK
jgi:hypothetical protein